MVFGSGTDDSDSPKWAPIGDRAYWTEIRTMDHYFVIGSELAGNGIQIFDAHKLLDIKGKKPVKFSNDKDLSAHWNETLPVGSSHNVVVNEDARWAAAVGTQPRGDSNPCNSGIHFIDLSEIAEGRVSSMGCNGDDGYVHDAQCLAYKGPDEKYQGHHICYGYNEDTLTIYDVTNPRESYVISRISYEGATCECYLPPLSFQSRIY